MLWNLEKRSRGEPIALTGRVERACFLGVDRFVTLSEYHWIDAIDRSGKQFFWRAEHFHALAVSPGGLLAAASDREPVVVALDPKTGAELDRIALDRDDAPTALAFGVDGALWIGTASGLAVRYEPLHS